MKQSAPRSFLEAASIVGMQPVLLGLNIDASRMMKALQTPDDIGAIIRVHKDLHRELKRIASVMVPKSRRRNARSVSELIECLKAAGMSESRLVASRRINLIRNAFVHSNKECFDETDVNGLLKAIRLVLGEDFTPSTVHDLTTDPCGEWNYPNMDHKGQFCQLGLTAVALVASIENEFEKHSLRPKFPRLLRFGQIQEATKEHTLLVFLQHH